jgi:hypothetical protein
MCILSKLQKLRQLVSKIDIEAVPKIKEQA